MDLNKRNLIDRILLLSDTEVVVAAIISKYSIRYKKSKNDVVQSYVNSIVMDIMEEEIRARKDTETILKNVISTNEFKLNVY